MKKYNQTEVDEHIMAELQETEKAMELVANANMDYIEISKQKCNMLQDMEDIMSNQLGNIFKLSKWVVNLMDLVSLKVCDEQEWEHLSNHYNQATGAAMEYNPIQDTTYSTNDFPMHEADRDELSKARMALDSAHTTIKNLSEVVVSVSCTANIIHQE